MRFNRLPKPTSSIIIFGIILTLLVLDIVFSPIPYFNTQGAPTATEQLLAEAESSLNDSLPHYEFKRKEDSIRRKIQEENVWIGSSGAGWKFFPVGNSDYSENGTASYYFYVSGYYIKDGILFFRKDGKNYLKYFLPQSIDGNGTIDGEEKITETQLRFVNEDKQKNNWLISFPVSKTLYNILNVVFLVLMIIVGGFSFAILLFLPLKVLLLIAKGKAFTEEVIGCLYTISRFLLLLWIVWAVPQLILHLILKSQIPYPFHFSIYNDLMTGQGFLISGLIVLLFAKAFLHGYELQQEQDLTV